MRFNAPLLKRELLGSWDTEAKVRSVTRMRDLLSTLCSPTLWKSSL